MKRYLFAKTLTLTPSSQTTLKLVGGACLLVLLTTDSCWATLDEQVEKASGLVLGNVATLVVGGATAFGGTRAIIQGNIFQGMAIIGTGVITGIGIALAKAGTLFSVLS